MRIDRFAANVQHNVAQLSTAAPPDFGNDLCWISRIEHSLFMATYLSILAHPADGRKRRHTVAGILVMRLRRHIVATNCCRMRRQIARRLRRIAGHANVVAIGLIAARARE